MEEKKTMDRLQSRLLNELPKAEQAVPAFNEFLGQLIVAFGGPDTLASEFYRTYTKAKEGSSARVQLLLKMCELLLRNTQHFGAPQKVEELTNEELASVLGAFLKPPENGEPTPATDGSASAEKNPGSAECASEGPS